MKLITIRRFVLNTNLYYIVYPLGPTSMTVAVDTINKEIESND